MASVNTNISATIAQNALTKNERSMNTAMERLATGKRINGAKDDAAGSGNLLTNDFPDSWA
jgi:flagellin